MKTPTLRLTTTASLAALALCLAPLVSAQSQDKDSGSAAKSPAATPAAAPTAAQPASATAMAATRTSDHSSAAIQVAAADVKDHTAKKIEGRKVRGSDDKDLGTVKDLLVDPQSGAVTYAVVSSGGFAGIGNTLHLVPFRALKPGAEKNEFAVDVDEAGWKQLPPLSEDTLDAPKITVSDEQRRQLAQHFEQSAGAASADYTGSISAQLVRASDLRGKDVQSGNTHLGSVEALVIDPNTSTATALLDPKKDVANTDQKFIVPLSQLSLAQAKHAPITTTLTAADFSHVQSGHDNVAATGSASVADTAGSSSAPTPVVSPSASTSVAASGATMSESQQSASIGTKSETNASTAAHQTASGTSSTEQSQDIAAATKSSATAAPSSGEENLSPTGRTTDEKNALAKTDEKPDEKATSHQERETDKVASAQTPNSSNASAAKDAELAKPAGEIASNRESTKDQDAMSSADKSTGAQSSSLAKSDQPSASATTTPSDVEPTLSKEGQVASTSAANTEPALSPTGQTSADQTPKASAALIAAAQSVRKALDDDSSLARADVRVVPEGAKLVVRGTVKDEQVKTAIEKKVKEAANGTEVDSEITVKNQ